MPADELARRAIDRGAVKHPGELAELVAFMRGRPRPRALLEIGVFEGGTLWLWRQLAHPDGYVLGVDVKEPDCEDCDYGRAHIQCPRRRAHENVWALFPGARADRFIGNSRSSAARAAVARAFPDGLDFLHVDGDHTRAGAWRDVELYGPLMREDGLLVIDDIALELDGCSGDEPAHILVGGLMVPAREWGPAVVWEQLRLAPGACAIAHEGGQGLGLLTGREWLHWVHGE